MDRDEFKAMSIDELWTLHKEVDEVLAARVIAKKIELERRLERLQLAGSDFKSRT